MNALKDIGCVGLLLAGESTLSLSTVDEAGYPSVTPLFYVVDEALRLYWLSSKRSAHSSNLLRNSNAAIAVYRSTENWREIFGVQMRGTVEIVGRGPLRKKIRDLYCKRFHLGGIFRLEISRATMFCFTPTWFRYLDNSRGFGYKSEGSLDSPDRH